MKKLLSIKLMLIFASVCDDAFSQNELLNEMTIAPPSLHYKYCENLGALFHAYLEYPSGAINDGIQGTEVIRFAVSPAGEIEDLTVINSISEDIDEAVLRVLQITDGNWKPGSVDGKPATMVKEVSVVFVLHSYDNMLKTAKHYLDKANELLFIQERPEKALHYYCKAAALLPNNESVLMVQGYCLDQLGRTEEADRVRERVEFLSDSYNSVVFPESGKVLSGKNFDRILVVLAK